MYRIFTKGASFFKGLTTYAEHCHFISGKRLTRLIGERNLITKASNALPFSEIPLVKGYPVIGSLVEFVSNLDKLHELLDRRIKEYGPIYREQIGFGEKSQQVFTANMDDWENVLHGETRGNPAERKESWSLNAYAEKCGRPSFSTIKGDEFERIKNSIKPLMMPRNVANLVPPLSDVTDDLLGLLASNIKTNGIVEDIRDVIHKWSFECGGYIVFQTRLGLLSEDENNIKEVALTFFNSAREFFELLYRLETGFPHHRSLKTTMWKEYERSLDEVHECCKQLYYKFGEHVFDKKAELTDRERIVNAQGVMVASVDTTAVTALWTLIELSRNPEVQEKLHDEISNIPADGQLTSSNLQLPYLKGFLKEMFRVRPLTALYIKTLTEDLILSGYEVPTGCTVNLMTGAYNKDDWFVDADTVKPERWYRGNKAANSSSSTPHPFSILPFGHGHRACVGRRIAENELLIFIRKVVQRFKISPVKEYDTKFRIFLVPEGKISLKLEERR